ncbi:MAG TPA: hypothetical protein DCE03_04590 [Synergistaceae bacterium]|jgi:phytoene dehydrogenase-like protein|nr:MAG: Uncharacterized protein XD80_0891 [Synergistales bacterium 53_16]KUL04235.1 MAG: Uncharacterized protein XE12_0346 [Synergistales bacterium 54_9]MDK2845501.1 hypothetical protein [Synergistales bacterium]HAA47749.1 hypothetical protein [Synergistaceae bacterium]MDN5336436.1 hypothetical protein [Synergistales bacterium]
MTQSNDLQANSLSWKASRELESFREELEKQFREEKTKLDAKKEQLRVRLDEMAENTLQKVASEWEAYEKLCESESRAFRGNLEKVLGEAVDDAFIEKVSDEVAQRLLKRILRSEDSPKDGEGIKS